MLYGLVQIGLFGELFKAIKKRLIIFIGLGFTMVTYTALMNADKVVFCLFPKSIIPHYGVILLLIWREFLWQFFLRIRFSLL